MKALSIRQPWAWLILHAGKDIENRVWSYVPRQTGRIYIHAAKGMTREEYEDALTFAWQIDLTIKPPSFEQMERGGIVGTVEIEGYIDNDPNDHRSKWYLGNLGIILRNPQPLPFTPCKGALGFFTPTEQP